MRRRVLIFVASALFFVTLSAAAAPTAPASQMITVNGVRLEYLDWGGRGAPLIFLAGFGDTPYIYNDFAPEFRSKFHCLGLTRRGFGRSEHPQSGYELDNLVQDVASFIEALGLRNVTVVGHSFGGTEAIRLSELRPDLVRRVVLLDTAYDANLPSTNRAMAKIMPALAGMPMNEVARSLDNYREFQKRLWLNVWSDASEANLREQVLVNDDGSVQQRSPGRVSEASFKDRDAGKWRITRIPVPALLIFANGLIADRLSRVTLDESSIVEIRHASDEVENARREQIERFRRDSPKARIVILDHTLHRCFIHKPKEVLAEMKQFLR